MWFLLLWACDSGSSTEPAPVCLPGVTLTDEAGVPLANGDALTIVLGPQAGYHFDLFATVQGLGPDVQLAPLLTVDGTDFAVAGEQFPENRALSEWDGCGGHTEVFRAFLREREREAICFLDGRVLDLMLSATGLDSIDVVETEVQIVSYAPGSIVESCP